MNDNPVTPPSLIGAGIATQPQPPQSLVGALRSQGSLPAEAMAQMAPPPQASLGLAAGSGMLSALAGQAGQNPYLAQQAQQANQQQTQQYHMAQIAQRAQQARQAQEAKRQEALLRVSQELLQGDNEDGRIVGAKGIATYAKSVGLDIPDSVVQSMATRRLTPTEYNDILKRMGRGEQPQEIARIYPSVKPQDFADIQRVAKNPVALKSVGLETPEERRTSELNARDKELTVWAKNKGIALDSPVYSRMVQLAKRPIDEMTDPEVQALKARAEADVEIIERKKRLATVEEEEAIKHRNRMAEIAEREAQKVKNKPTLTPALRAKSLALQQEYVALPLKEERIKQVKDAVDLLNKEGIIQQGDTIADVAMAKYNRATKVGRKDINQAIQNLTRYGTALLVGAERDLGMQAGTLRLKIIAEAEAGNILAIPDTGWKDFFSIYDRGISDRKDLIEQQLEAMGVDIPTPKSQRTPSRNPLAPTAPGQGWGKAEVIK